MLTVTVNVAVVSRASVGQFWAKFMSGLRPWVSSVVGGCSSRGFWSVAIPASEEASVLAPSPWKRDPGSCCGARGGPRPEGPGRARAGWAGSIPDKLRGACGGLGF